ncbi:MAG TPA: hypothetical protein VG095_03975 [Chthoniobacterales bacterium]|nr:hypothetical protein [Chthoniobacterales bacterium]
MFTIEEERFRLAIPLHDAVAFAMGWSDLGYDEPQDALRKIIGFLAIDALEYAEQWRMAALLRTCLQHRWAESGA